MEEVNSFDLVLQHQQQQTPNTMKIAVSDQIRKLLLDHVNQANHDGGGFPEGVAAGEITPKPKHELIVMSLI